MKTKLLCLKYAVAACVLASTVGAANASTISFTGTFGPGTDTSYCIPADCGGQNIPPFYWGGGSLSGTFDYAGPNVTAMNILVNVQLLGHTFTLEPTTSITFSQSDSGLSLDVFHFLLAPDGYKSLSLDFNLATSLFLANYSAAEEYIPPDKVIASAYWSGGGTFTVTPLPAALPLFATGLVGLGLLGWRRKRVAV